MPQLFSRMDSASWVTPSIADILDQGSAPPGGDGSIRERMLTLQKELEDLQTPARIINVRSTPSYTLYIARPEMIGQLGNRRPVAANEIRRSVAQIAESHKDWTLGFMPQLAEVKDAVGILLRTEEHRPLSLRRLLVRSTFRNYNSTLAFTLGITLEQQLLIRDLTSVEHLLVVGTGTAKQHFIRGVLLTLLLLNSPGELRIALAGESSDVYKPLASTPHALGRLLVTAADGQRLLDGLVKEVQRREQVFKDAEVENISAYNDGLREQGKAELPRIVLLVDSLSDPGWQEARENWSPPLAELLSRGGQAGIHLLLNIAEMDEPGVPKNIKNAVPTQVIIRSAAGELGNDLEGFHPSLLRFIDAFVIERKSSGRRSESEITPVELCAISNQELQRAVAYWQAAVKQRFEDTQVQSVSGRTGVTDILRPQTAPASGQPPAPPVPEKPSAEALTRATQALAVTRVQEEPAGEVAEVAEIGEVAEITEIEGVEETAELQVAEIVEIPEMPEILEPPTVETELVQAEREVTRIAAAAAAEAELALDGAAADTRPTTTTRGVQIPQTITLDLMTQSQALAAYLGWLGVGPLRDIFGLSIDEALVIIRLLQEHEILEKTDSPTPRFLRLSQEHDDMPDVYG